MVKRGNPSNNLMETIKKKKWCSINQYLDEAKIPNENNTYALHDVCIDPSAPLQVVKDIYNAHPEAALVKNKFEDTPISSAVGTFFEDAVRFLANACPEAIFLTDISNCTLIQTAVSLMNHNNMIDSMIEANPRAAFVPDNEEESAFQAFFRHWNVFMRIFLHCNQNVNDEALDDYIGYGEWKVKDIYHKACLFLKAVHVYRRGESLDDSNLLHCALREESCPSVFSKLLIKLHPEQVLKRDASGNLPIHIITGSRDTSDEDCFLCFDCFKRKSKLVSIEYGNGGSKYCCEDCLEMEPSQPVQYLFRMRPGKFHTIFLIINRFLKRYLSLVYKVDEIVNELLAIAPQMVLISNSEGNYALNIAIHNKLSYNVIYQLYKAFPGTGKIRDEKTQLLPFMLAALGRWKDETDQLNVSYTLLREDPILIFGT